MVLNLGRDDCKVLNRVWGARKKLFSVENGAYLTHGV